LPGDRDGFGAERSALYFVDKYLGSVSGFPVFRFSGFPVFRFSGFPVFRFSGFPVFRFSGFPVFRFSGFLENLKTRFVNVLRHVHFARLRLGAVRATSRLWS
jgi:hypothetical protein